MHIISFLLSAQPLRISSLGRSRQHQTLVQIKQSLNKIQATIPFDIQSRWLAIGVEAVHLAQRFAIGVEVVNLAIPIPEKWVIFF